MMRPARALSPVATDLINRYQGGIPLTNRPFADIARAIGCEEDRVISTIEDLLNKRWLTRFGPLFDAAALGGGLTLAALSVPERDYDAIASLVNRHPQVAHNYRREHELNMWFVIATGAHDEIPAVLDSIERQTGLSVYNFPKQREFYVGLWLHLDHGRIDTIPVPNATSRLVGYEKHDIDRRIIEATQSGLALTPEPWRALAERLGCDTRTIPGRLQHMLDAGVIRRIGLVPNHYKLGLRANGMTVWDVSDELVDSLGTRVGSFDFVSHCYQRPRRLPKWRYNLFAMVHGHDRDEVEAKTRRIAQSLGDDCSAHEILYSRGILKKTGLRLAA